MVSTHHPRSRFERRANRRRERRAQRTRDRQHLYPLRRWVSTTLTRPSSHRAVHWQTRQRLNDVVVHHQANELEAVD
jgi:hypothetical protein